MSECNCNQTSIRFKKLHPLSRIPTKVYETDAGFDFHCVEEFDMRPEEIKIVDVGLSCALEDGYELQIRPRSGHATRGLTIVNSPGTIDSHYRGPLKMILKNVGFDVLHFKEGAKIAQGVVNKLPTIKIIEVESLDETDRNQKGFGSSDE